MKKWLVLLAALMFSLPLGCGDEDGDGEETPDVVEQEVADTGFPNLTGKVYRVNKLAATQPTDQINNVWAVDMENYDLVLLFHVISHDTTTGIAEFEVTSAIADKEEKDGEFIAKSFQYCREPWKTKAKIEVTDAGVNFNFTELVELDILTPTVSKSFHIFGITGQGKFSKDGTKILDCWLQGVIDEAQTYDLCLTIPGMGVANFHGFMNALKLCPDLDHDEDGKVDSYKFSGHMGAVEETHLFKEGIKPIESIVEECPLDEKVCVPKAK
jgi:hypothetical protein